MTVIHGPRRPSGTFDVTMGAYDGAQVADLVGLLVLDKIKKEIPEISFWPIQRQRYSAPQKNEAPGDRQDQKKIAQSVQ